MNYEPCIDITDALSDRLASCEQAEQKLRDNEERFRCLSACSPVGIFLTDVEGRCTYTNPRCQVICSFTLAESLGAGWSQLIHPEDQQRVLADWFGRTRAGCDYSDEFRLQTQTGTVRWVHIRSSPMFCDQGELVGHVGTVEDISDRKQAEDALKQAKAELEIRVQERTAQLRNANTQLQREIAERKLREEALRKSEATNRALLNAIPDAMFRIAKDGTLVDFKRAKDWETEVSPQQFLGKKLCELLPIEIARLIIPGIVQALQTGDVHSQEYQLLLHGKLCDYEARIVGIGAEEALMIVRDITERKQAEEALRQSEEQYRRIIETTSEGVWVIDADNQTIFANRQMAQMLGYTRDEMLGMPLFTFINQDTLAIAISHIERRRYGIRESHDCKFRRRDGSDFWALVSTSPIFDQAGQYVGSLQMLTDITERKQAEIALQAHEAFLTLILDNIPQFIFWKDRNCVYLGCNRNFARAAGLNNPAEIIGKTDYDLPWQAQESDFFRECDALVMDTDTPRYHILETQLQADGKQAWLDTNKIPLHDSEGNVVGILGTYEDITDRQIAQEKIRYQALHDLLTGLPNRTQFDEQLALSLSKAQNHQAQVAVMFLDLDRFKTINDTLGHAIGDRLLQAVAQRLSTYLPQDFTLSRWGGDEFTLLLPQTSSATEVAQLAQQILDALKPTFNLDEPSQLCRSTSLHISASIGIALYPQHGKDTQTLLRNADAALYSAKQQGRNNYQFYTAAMNSQASELLILENQLHHALKRREFVLYYQPQVNTSTGEITGMEALVRWQHPKYGLVSPAKFIPLAEETGLIVPIGEWVLQTACAQNKAWQRAGFPPLRVAVNLSARQFQQPSLLESVAQTLQHIGLSPEFLELEITESIAMQDAELTQTILRKFHQMGVHLSIDDFGTGYSSLGYLKQFPLDTLKIDKSFVRDLSREPQNAGIINAIMTLGKGFNLRVIAEGVETEAEKNCLLSLQCKEMQGYLSSPPLPAEEATKLLRNSRFKTSKISIVA